MNLNTAGWASRVLTPLLRIIRGATNATVPVIAISEPINSETAALVNADVALVVKGNGALLGSVPDDTAAGGSKRGQYATDWQRGRTGPTTIASGQYSTIGGGQRNTSSSQSTTIAGGDNNTANNLYCAVAGGQTNVASGQYACIVAGGSNTASSNYSFVGGGQSNTAQTNTHATVCGGNGNTASGIAAVIAGGVSNTASAAYAFIGGGDSNTASSGASVVAGGRFNTANGDHSAVLGGRRGTTRTIDGYFSFPACNIPISNAAGVTQSALLLLGRQTTNDTPTVLTSNTSAAGTTNQVILPNNSAYSFSGEVIAGVTAAGDTARWTINGAIKRGANAASTTMVGTPTVTMTHNDAGAAAWTVAVTADTTNGGIKVEVTGAASTTIRWVAKITTTEMTY